MMQTVVPDLLTAQAKRKGRAECRQLKLSKRARCAWGRNLSCSESNSNERSDRVKMCDDLEEKDPLDLGGSCCLVSDDHTSVQWFKRANELQQLVNLFTI